MRTTVHVAMILFVGVCLGLAFRAFRPARAPGGPGPDEVVYTNDLAADGLTEDEIAAVGNDTPSHPPEDAGWLSQFELTERSGKTIKSDDLLGEPYVVSFFFSTCPSICVQQNQRLKELQDAFAGEGVRFVAISVDPETDTPEILQQYAARFGADKDQWLFLTGDLNYIRRIGSEIYRQPVNKQFHTERFVLVDPKGEIEGFYSWPDAPQFEKLQAKIREYLENAGNDS
jgi:protein SCO1/2